MVTFKFHWLIHCLHYSEFMNPKYLWTYSGEDNMSRCKTLLKSCLNGRKQLPALQRFGRQYARAICVEIDKEFSPTPLCVTCSPAAPKKRP